MSARSFRSVFMVASCAGAALGCYLVSLRVASERAALEDVETQIVLAQRDLRLLQTEIGTRGRLAQLERWNVKVLALSAPSADQFLTGGFELARLVAPEQKVDLDAPVVLASAPAGTKLQPEGAEPAAEDALPAGAAPKQLMHVTSLKSEARGPVTRSSLSLKPSAPAAETRAAQKPAVAKSGGKPVPAKIKGDSKDKPLAKASASAKPVAAKPVAAKPVAAKPKTPTPASKTAASKSADADPLAPLASSAKPKKVASAPTKVATRKP